jgi:hypothetical protein
MEQLLTLEQMTKAAYAVLVTRQADYPKWEDLTEEQQNSYYVQVHNHVSPPEEQHPSEVPFLLPPGFKDKIFHTSIQLHVKF